MIRFQRLLVQYIDARQREDDQHNHFKCIGGDQQGQPSAQPGAKERQKHRRQHPTPTDKPVASKLPRSYTGATAGAKLIGAYRRMRRKARNQIGRQGDQTAPSGNRVNKPG